jgi:DNA invertase Pin-like site-specific DNA recombinase
MTEGKFVSYLRVSTDQQGRSGLGLEGQRKAVADYLNGGRWKLVTEFVEVESGRKSDRPELTKALSACRLHGAMLVVAKLDRLARNAHFLLGLRDAGVEFVACDMPSANRLTVGIMAMVAEEEARMISDRTKSALAAAKARGTRLGRAGRRNLTTGARKIGASRSARRRIGNADQRAIDLRPTIESLRENGKWSLAEIAVELNALRIPAPRGGAWQPTQVARILRRAETIDARDAQRRAHKPAESR